ncbi:MAG: FeoB-associated Cys-rich membrane protein [Lachnospiraceae bacterium]|nr:FeoB-associated Cys-rich membrane protein [Lachnospiraceae bacterium]
MELPAAMEGENIVNIWDIVIGLILVAIVVGAVYGCIRRKKKGCCNGGSCCNCHKKKSR